MRGGLDEELKNGDAFGGMAYGRRRGGSKEREDAAPRRPPTRVYACCL